MSDIINNNNLKENEELKVDNSEISLKSKEDVFFIFLLEWKFNFKWTNQKKFIKKRFFIK